MDLGFLRKWTFYYKIVDLFFVCMGSSSEPTKPSGYGPDIPELIRHFWSKYRQDDYSDSK